MRIPAEDEQSFFDDIRIYHISTTPLTLKLIIHFAKVKTQYKVNKSITILLLLSSNNSINSPGKVNMNDEESNA